MADGDAIVPTREDAERIKRVLAADGEDFVTLVRIAGLNPGRDFRRSSLRDVRFDGLDLGGFDFSGSRLVGCSFKDALIRGAKFDGATTDPGALQEAKDWDAAPTPEQPIAPEVPATSLDLAGLGRLTAHSEPFEDIFREAVEVVAVLTVTPQRITVDGDNGYFVSLRSCELTVDQRSVPTGLVAFSQELFSANNSIRPAPSSDDAHGTRLSVTLRVKANTVRDGPTIQASIATVRNWGSLATIPIEVTFSTRDLVVGRWQEVDRPTDHSDSPSAKARAKARYLSGMLGTADRIAGDRVVRSFSGTVLCSMPYKTPV